MIIFGTTYAIASVVGLAFAALFVAGILIYMVARR